MNEAAFYFTGVKEHVIQRSLIHILMFPFTFKIPKPPLQFMHGNKIPTSSYAGMVSSLRGATKKKTIKL
jgi:hypothetical protein